MSKTKGTRKQDEIKGPYTQYKIDLLKDKELERGLPLDDGMPIEAERFDFTFAEGLKQGKGFEIDK